MDLLGYKEATSLGYSLNFYTTDKQLVAYTKEGVHLTVWLKDKDLRATLEYIWRLIVIKTPEFAFPNKNFQVFEGQILLVKGKLEG